MLYQWFSLLISKVETHSLVEEVIKGSLEGGLDDRSDLFIALACTYYVIFDKIVGKLTSKHSIITEQHKHALPFQALWILLFLFFLTFLYDFHSFFLDQSFKFLVSKFLS